MKAEHTPAPWSVYLRKKAEGECLPGLWIHNPETHRTVCDGGAPNEFPLSNADRKLIEGSPKLLDRCVRLYEYLVSLRELGAVTGPTIDREIEEVAKVLVEVTVKK